MFIRRIRSRKSVCFQIGEKRYGRFKLIHHVGCSSTPAGIEALKIKAKKELNNLVLQNQIALFPQTNEPPKAKLLNWHITGYHLVFGHVYDIIGLPANTLRDLVVARIVYPQSKSATVRYLNRYLGVTLKRDGVYRFLDTLDKNQLTQTALNFVSAKNNGISIFFYDVTTLYFETETEEDDFRKKGYSKDHRGDMPQILIGLSVDHEGYPFDFEFFEGNTFEGHTFQISIEKLITKYEFKKLTVVADAGMLSTDNLIFLEKNNLHYIIGAKLKNMSQEITRQITAHPYEETSIWELDLKKERLIIEYSPVRAQKDAHNRDRIIKKLKEKLEAGKPVIYKNKYLALKDQGNVTGLDERKIEEDKKFDGLKGYITNSSNKHTHEEIISQYHSLWQVEKAFRMSKGDLKERPVFHQHIKRIKSHLLLCFVSLLVMKETEKILKRKKYSLQEAIEILGKVGEGEVRIGNINVEMDSELTPEAKGILKLFEGH